MFQRYQGGRFRLVMSKTLVYNSVFFQIGLNQKHKNDNWIEKTRVTEENKNIEQLFAIVIE